MTRAHGAEPATATERATAAFGASLAAMKPLARKRHLERIERAVKAGRKAYLDTVTKAKPRKKAKKVARKKVQKRRAKAAPGRDWTVPLW